MGLCMTVAWLNIEQLPWGTCPRLCGTVGMVGDSCQRGWTPLKSSQKVPASRVPNGAIERRVHGGTPGGNGKVPTRRG